MRRNFDSKGDAGVINATTVGNIEVMVVYSMASYQLVGPLV